MALVHIVERPGEGYALETEIWVPRPRPEVFEFFSKAENLDILTPASLGFRIETTAPIGMTEGTRIDYRISLFGIPFRWRTLISAWEPPERFIDEQLKGPYRHWIHEHRFIEEDGGTRIRDRVAYGVPGGPLIHATIVRRQLEGIFTYRAQVIVRRFGETGSGPTP